MERLNSFPVPDDIISYFKVKRITDNFQGPPIQSKRPPLLPTPPQFVHPQRYGPNSPYAAALSLPPAEFMAQPWWPNYRKEIDLRRQFEKAQHHNLKQVSRIRSQNFPNKWEDESLESDFDQLNIDEKNSSEEQSSLDDESNKTLSSEASNKILENKNVTESDPRQHSEENLEVANSECSSVSSLSEPSLFEDIRLRKSLNNSIQGYECNSSDESHNEFSVPRTWCGNPHLAKKKVESQEGNSEPVVKKNPGIDALRRYFNNTGCQKE